MTTAEPPSIVKYPRTPHLEGSRLQPGDGDLAGVPYASLAGRAIVVEEKLDGANAAVSFARGGRLLLQSRGHYLVGGAREKHFDLFKRWASTHEEVLRARLGEHYVMYGEWLYAKHTVYYDALPAYFLEFDVLDREGGQFLSTERRRALLAGAPVASVPLLFTGVAPSYVELVKLLGRSLYKSGTWASELAATAEARGLDAARVVQETDPSPEMEGLYIKVEDAEVVLARSKYVRRSFLTSVADSGSHWLNRPIVPNGLAMRLASKVAP